MLEGRAAREMQRTMSLFRMGTVPLCPAADVRPQGDDPGGEIHAPPPTLEGEHRMTAIEYRRLEPVTVYAASGVAPGGEGVPAVVDRILPPLHGALEAAGVEYREPGTFWYEPLDGGDLRVWVSWIAGDEPVEGDGWQVVELPAAERSAVTTYRGEMSGIGEAWGAFMQAVA